MLIATSTATTTISENDAVIAPKQRITAEMRNMSKEGIKTLIRGIFGEDNAILAENIARCESQMRQFDEKGVILRNPVTPDVGIFQINVDYHSETAKNLGIDFYTPIGNIKYAKYLFDNYGVSPWRPSNNCHKLLSSP